MKVLLLKENLAAEGSFGRINEDFRKMFRLFYLGF
jgi:hypothetical protein